MYSFHQYLLGSDYMPGYTVFYVSRHQMQPFVAYAISGLLVIPPGHLKATAHSSLLSNFL